MSDDDLFVTEIVTKRGRPPLDKRAMTPAARQRRHRKLAKHQAKREKRAAREMELVEATRAAAARLGAELFNVIYADPPWRFEPYSRETGMDRAADNHYPTMTIDEIKALPVPAADHTVLFLCATMPMLDQAIDVMRAWGFTYRSGQGWDKILEGTGYWFRNQLELLLVGTRGNVPAPIMGDQPPQIIRARRGPHSEKPEAHYKMIEDMFPNVPKLLDMFARKPRGGRWISWGNEIVADAAE